MEKGQKSAKHTHKTKDRVTRTLLTTRGELWYSVRVSSSCSTSVVYNCLQCFALIIMYHLYLYEYWVHTQNVFDHKVHCSTSDSLIAIVEDKRGWRFSQCSLERSIFPCCIQSQMLACTYISAESLMNLKTSYFRREHCLRCLCLFTCGGVQHMLRCVFVLFFFVLCTLCCQLLWIVLFFIAPSVFSDVYLQNFWQFCYNGN